MTVTDTYDPFLVKERRRTADNAFMRLVDALGNQIILDGRTDHNKKMDLAVAYFWGRLPR